MNRKILHFASVAVLLFLSGLFIYFYVSGRIERYVAPEFRTWALAAGLGLAVLALFNLATAKQAEGCGHDHSHDYDHDHDPFYGDGECCGGHHEHGHGRSQEHHGEEDHHNHEESPASIALALVVLTVPMLVAANYSQDAFSVAYQIRWTDITESLTRIEAKRKIERDRTFAVGSPVGAGVTDENPGAPVGAGTGVGEGGDGQVGGSSGGGDDDEWGEFTLEDLKEMVPQSSAGNFMLEVPQLFYTANDAELQKVLEGLPVETIAQVMRVSQDVREMNPKAAQRRLRLFRMFVECCAADMRPLPVTIEFDDGIPEYEEMGWVKVVGEIRYERIDGITTPIIDVRTIEPTPQPMDMMVY